MSCDDIAIRVQNLSKCYTLYDAPRDRLKQFILPRLQRAVGTSASNYYREFWALKDISLDVKKGETVGIIGRNGSGKSTLLQIICGTLTPTTGRVETKGRVAALLELGSGFNPEFTGRENVYLNGNVLGLSKREIDSRFDGICAFADIGEFIDQPLKTYSSGMYVRLAFAVIAHVSADILIIDEALAVGDMAFQAKCMVRIRRMMESGATVLFVSHDVGTVKALCGRCLYLERGKAVSFAKTADVTALYIARSHLEINAALSMSHRIGAEDNAIGSNRVMLEQNEALVSKAPLAVRADTMGDLGLEATRYGDGRVTVLDVKLLGHTGVPADHLEVDEVFQIQIAVRVNANLPDIAWGYSMRDLKGQMLVAMMSTSDPTIVPRPAKAGETLVLGIKGKNSLHAGVYALAVGVELPVMTNQQHVFLEVVESALVFKSVWPADTKRLFPGMVKVPVEFEVLAASADGESGRRFA
jgi:lipopolysaccharide transport system ATP-binding protein